MKLAPSGPSWAIQVLTDCQFLLVLKLIIPALRKSGSNGPVGDLSYNMIIKTRVNSLIFRRWRTGRRRNDR